MRKTRQTSISMSASFLDALKVEAKKKGFTGVSALIVDTLEKYVIIGEDVTSVVLKVPNSIRSDREALTKWLEAKASALLKALLKAKTDVQNTPV